MVGGWRRLVAQILLRHPLRRLAQPGLM